MKIKQIFTALRKVPFREVLYWGIVGGFSILLIVAALTTKPRDVMIEVKTLQDEVQAVKADVEAIKDAVGIED